MRIDGRPNHIEDYLVKVRTGQWFGWSDSKNKVYANLIVHDGGSKPSESDCTNGLTALQDSWDLQNDSYKSNRRKEWCIVGLLGQVPIRDTAIIPTSWKKMKNLESGIDLYFIK